VVLASRSPQRRAILEQLGVDFRALDPGVEETAAGDPEQVARENAQRKARAGARAAPEASIVLGVDTVVALDGQLYGKPSGPGEARRTLSTLSGRRHAVIGGLALVRQGGGLQTAVETTRVEFRALSSAMIEWYVGSGEWRGRAGGYAIQGRGAALVARIEGDYLNVVGLPLGVLLDLVPELTSGP
jgi:septum formation protein